MRTWLLAVGIALITFANVSGAEPTAKPIGDFSLADYRGKNYSLSDFQDRKIVVVAFIGTECPLAKLYAPRLAELATQYGPKGVAFIGIDPNTQDGVTQIGAFARQNNISFPILKDLNNLATDLFAAKRTPEVFVLDERRVVRYRGRIDDQYAIGVQRDKPRERDLAKALDELLDGQTVSKPTTDSPGCLIGRTKSQVVDNSVTYAEHIAPIFNRRCVECHRPGDIGPFSLTEYKKAAGWADMIAEVVEDGRMPPWHANPKYGHFANDRRLSADEKKLIRTWVDNGAPAGDLAKAPPTPKFTDGWELPKAPDFILAMRDKPYDVPAEGTVRYQYFLVDPKFTEDKWISSVEVRPGNRAVVHHILILMLKKGAGFRDEDGGGTRGYLAAYVPGLRPTTYPAGMAKKVPAGATLVFQIHYTPNGTKQQDKSEIGFVFADPKTITHEVKTTSAVSRTLSIPPMTADYAVEATSRGTPEGATLLGFMPHMHLRGSAFSYEAVFPDGRREMLLDVPHYDFNWQTSYRLAEPRKLPTGTRMHCVAKYDNSENNPSNPDPKARVRWGEQTWNEMMIGYFDIAAPRSAAAAPDDKEPAIPAEGVAIPERFKTLLGRFDLNKNAKLTKDEIDKMPPEVKSRVLDYIRRMP